MKKYKTVDEYMANLEQWQGELLALREILCATELTETVKWGSPVYTYNGKNIVGLGGFKSYFGLWFFQGALLQDKQNKLINAQKDKTKAMRQWRFASTQEIDKKLIVAYVEEAIENQKAGKEIKPEKKSLAVPPELQQAFKQNPSLKKAFAQFKLSEQREFTDYIGEAKREATKLKRLEKIMPMILEKVGLYEKYKK